MTKPKPTLVPETPDAPETFGAPNSGPPPDTPGTWPDLSFAEILRLGFKGYVITSLDHPVVQRLRGL